MSARFTLLPDPQFEPLRASLQQRVLAAAKAVDPENLPGVLDSLMRGALRDALIATRSDDLLVWLAVDAPERSLAAAFGLGAHAEALVQRGFKQPLKSGLISMVFDSEQPFCENDVHLNARHDKTADSTLGARTSAMVAVPFYFAQTKRGIISCVRMADPADGAAGDGYSVDDLRAVQLASELVTRLLDFWLVGVTVGWRPE